MKKTLITETMACPFNIKNKDKGIPLIVSKKVSLSSKYSIKGMPLKLNFDYKGP